MLPDKFQERMREMLGEEAEEFLACLEGEKYQALRVNPLKGDWERFLQNTDFSLFPVPWEKHGYYYGKTDQPGRHPFHEAGLYYIQEPSAMAPAGLLQVHPGERVLDLCAAPGGKSTQLAAALAGEGILVCNEIHPARAEILSENIERLGICNAFVTNEAPEKLAARFPDYFDKLLVDAPCSGEGMFRKEEQALLAWSPENVRLCAVRQDQILDAAAGMLRPGGRMVYSTCTFAPAEDEGTVARFLMRHPDFALIEAEDVDAQISRGRGDWAADVDGSDLACPEEIRSALSRTLRLWPHKLKGEGHFAAVLRREGEENAGCLSDFCADLAGQKKVNRQNSISIREKTFRQEKHSRQLRRQKEEQSLEDYFSFARENLNCQWEGSFLRFGEQLYLVPPGAPSIEGLKVLRPGLHLGTLKKGRFEPSHALALALAPSQVRHMWDLPPDEPEMAAYLKGMTFPAEGEKGWYLITVDGYSIGWGKLAGNTMKNHYPRGLRK